MKISGNNIQSPKVHHRNRIAIACENVGKPDRADRIRNCGRNQVCRSYYCPRCKTRRSKRLEGRVLDYVQTEFADHEAARERMRYVTGLVALVPMRESAVKEATVATRKLMNAFVRAFPAARVFGGLEWEAVDIDGLRAWNGTEKAKRETLFSMLGMDAIDASGVMVLVHFHVLVDVRDCKESRMKAWLEKRICKSHRLQLEWKTIYEDQPDGLEGLAERTSSYLFKGQVQFSYRQPSLNVIQDAERPYLTDGTLWFLDSIQSIVSVLVIHDGYYKRQEPKPTKGRSRYL